MSECLGDRVCLKHKGGAGANHGPGLVNDWMRWTVAATTNTQGGNRERIQGQLGGCYFWARKPICASASNRQRPIYGLAQCTMRLAHLNCVIRERERQWSLHGPMVYVASMSYSNTIQSLKTVGSLIPSLVCGPMNSSLHQSLQGKLE